MPVETDTTAGEAPAESGWDERMRRTRAALADAARSLFVSKGFEATTASEIAEAAGVSERTFFRYFATKEAAALGDLRLRGEEMVERLAARPAGEPLAVSMQHTLLGLSEGARAQSERIVELELVRACPELLTYLFEMMLRWEAELAEIIRLRLDSGDALHARLLAATLTTLIRVAVVHTVETDETGESLFDVGARGLELLAPLFGDD